VNLSPTHVDISIHQARPTVHSAAGAVCMAVTIPTGDQRGLDHTVHLFFASTEYARQIGEGLMREAYRVDQIEKLKAADVSAHVPLPEPGAFVMKGPNE